MKGVTLGEPMPTAPVPPRKPHWYQPHLHMGNAPGLSLFVVPSLFRQQGGKTTATSCIACSLGLHGNMRNHRVWSRSARCLPKHQPRACLCWGQGK